MDKNYEKSLEEIEKIQDLFIKKNATQSEVALLINKKIIESNVDINDEISTEIQEEFQHFEIQKNELNKLTIKS